MKDHIKSACTSTSRTDCNPGRAVKRRGERDGHYRRYKHCIWVIKTSVFNLILKMQAVILMLISHASWAWWNLLLWCRIKNTGLANTQHNWWLGSTRKKTSGVSCHASVSEFHGYCGAYSHWKFQQTPIIKKIVPVTPEICNKAWREGVVTLPDINTRSIRLGDSVLYEYLPQGIIRVDSHMTSCQGSQVRLDLKW